MSISTPTSDVASVVSPRKGRFSFPFMRYRFYAFAFTTLLTVACAVSLATQGLNLGLDFTGGVLIEASRNTPFDAEALRASLAANGVEEATVQLADGDLTALIRVGLPEESAAETQALAERVTTALGEGATIEGRDVVGPQVSGELLRNGLLAAVLAIVMISLYVWFRFESKFGVAALVTTFHDVFVILGLFSFTQMTFDLTIIAALLTVAGYSVNDTVVVFDRIREMLRKHKRMSLTELIDEAVSATLSRTVVTGATTLVATLAILLFAGPVLQGFAISILAGVLIGTYSSIFVAAPLVIHVPGKVPGGRDGEERRVS